MLITTEKIRSYFKVKIVYAKQYAEVKVITEHGNVLIVQNIETGEKFPITKEKLMEINAIATEPKIVATPVQVKFDKPIKKKINGTNQGSLF